MKLAWKCVHALTFAVVKTWPIHFHTLHLCVFLHILCIFPLCFFSFSFHRFSFFIISIFMGSHKSLSFILQPTTAASQSCQPSLTWEPLNCLLLATHWSIHVSLASTWLEDQNTEPAGLMGAGQGNHHCVQVWTTLQFTYWTWKHAMCYKCKIKFSKLHTIKKAMEISVNYTSHTSPHWKPNHKVFNDIKPRFNCIFFSFSIHQNCI